MRKAAVSTCRSPLIGSTHALFPRCLGTDSKLGQNRLTPPVVSCFSISATWSYSWLGWRSSAALHLRPYNAQRSRAAALRLSATNEDRRTLPCCYISGPRMPLTAMISNMMIPPPNITNGTGC